MGPSNPPSPNKTQKGPRACVTCAKAKSRCIPGPVEGICERCGRLKKPCSSQVPARPRPRKGPRPTRVAELEKKLEHLTARVKSQVLPSSPPLSSPGSVAGTKRSYYGSARHPAFRHLFLADGIPAAPSGNTEEGRPRDGPAEGGAAQPPTPAIPPGACGAPQPSGSCGPPRADAAGAGMPTLGSPPDPTDSLWPRSSEADIFLETYRSHFAHLFPFVVAPPNKTSGELRRERPYMWKAMMMQACHQDGERQIALGNDLLRDIAVSAFTRPEKSLDLLQGLEVLIAWYHYNLHSFQMTNLLFLARSLCVSLGLTEAQGRLREEVHPPVCLERIRAFAGCYYLVTLLFTTSKKPDAFMNTSYLEACCQLLESKLDSPTDLLVVWLVRVQQLAQSISMTLTSRTTSLQIELPLAIVIGSFRQQIDAFRASLPESLGDNPSLRSHVHVAEMLLYEIGTREVQPAFYLTPMDRLELLWSCLSAAKSFLEIWFEHDVAEHPHFVCLSSFDSAYVLIMCLKLVTLDAPGWDLNIVRSAIALDKFVERQAHDLRAIAQRRRSKRLGPGPQGTPQEDPFSRLARKLDLLKACVVFELDSIYKPPTPAVQEQQPTSLAEATHEIVQGLDGWMWQDMFYGNDLDGTNWLDAPATGEA